MDPRVSPGQDMTYFMKALDLLWCVGAPKRGRGYRGGKSPVETTTMPVMPSTVAGEVYQEFDQTMYVRGHVSWDTWGIPPNGSKMAIPLYPMYLE